MGETDVWKGETGTETIRVKYRSLAEEGIG